jgi:multidrug efflux pump subunit AcrA (membrane-fusion protein)
MYKRKLSALWLVSSLFGVLLTSCATTSRSKPTPTPLPPMVSYEKSVFTVELGPIVSEKKIYGEIVPSKQDDLYFNASGYVDRVTVKQGDQVKQGDLLAEMEVTDLLDQLEQANIDLEVAQATLIKGNAQREYNLQRAQIDVTILEKRVELAKLDLEKAYTKDARVSAQLNLEIIEQNLALAKLDLTQAQEAVSTYEQQAVDRTQITVKRLTDLINNRRVYAPYDCIILRTSLRPGTQIEQFATVLKIGDPAELVVRTGLDYELNQILTKNSEIHMYLPDDDEEGPGSLITFMPNFMPLTLEESNKLATSTGQDYFYFSLPEGMDSSLVKVGMSVNLIVVIGRKDQALLLPPAAIREYRGQNYVIVLDGDRRRRVEINKIGLKAIDRWEITGDLQVGDQVQGP